MLWFKKSSFFKKIKRQKVSFDSSPSSSSPQPYYTHALTGQTWLARPPVRPPVLCDPLRGVHHAVRVLARAADQEVDKLPEREGYLAVVVLLKKPKKNIILWDMDFFKKKLLYHQVFVLARAQLVAAVPQPVFLDLIFKKRRYIQLFPTKTAFTN